MKKRSAGYLRSFAKAMVDHAAIRRDRPGPDHLSPDRRNDGRTEAGWRVKPERAAYFTSLQSSASHRTLGSATSKRQALEDYPFRVWPLTMEPAIFSRRC